MGKNDFLNENYDYIGIMADAGCCELTDEELFAEIKKESKNFESEITDTEIEWLVEAIREREEHDLGWFFNNYREKLTDKAKNFIEQTDYRAFEEFGMFKNADEVNRFAEEYGEDE